VIIALSGIALQLDLWISGTPAPDASLVREVLPDGAAREPPPLREGLNWHGFLQGIHAGYIWGTFGRILSLLAGVALTILSVTGAWVYIDMFRRRAGNGNRQIFWK
jgi:uncharacterized iron-regulated membrane protein